MGILENLQKEMTVALKASEKRRLETLRLLVSQVKKEGIDSGHPLTDDEIIRVLNKEAKRRKESFEMYQKGGREDLADQEADELKIIEEFLPESLSEEAIAAIVDEIIQSVGAQSIQDLGKVMGPVMQKTKGLADGKLVQEIVRKKLS